ncbi:MAG: amidohydrolase [Firmicutes bacterium]|nr:amidohydrolase [Bacillota bacterium]
MISLRRRIHQYPELGFEEVKTAALVAEELEKMGLEVTTQVARTGVVGVLRGGQPGKVVGLRADMDALRVQDGKENCPYRSRNDGVTHACGHDGHVAMLLGAAKYLSQQREELAGTIKFIFQPAEEEPGGAEPMIAAGVLSNPEVEAMLALHLSNNLPVGKIGLRYGATMAAVDRLSITIHGAGGHGAAPHQTVDAIVVAAQAVTALQTIVSRRLNPAEPAVVTLGTISGGYRHNVIADRVELTGTVRTLSSQVRDQIEQEIDRILAGVCAAYGARAEFELTPVYPATINAEGPTKLMAEVAADLLGAEGVIYEPHASMGGEDFSYFGQVPGGAAYIHVGSKNPAKGFVYPHHHPKFDFDEDALGYGAALMVQWTRRYLLGK